MRFAAAERLVGRRQRDRAEVVEPGQRVAGVDQVAQVPVAAAGQGREAGGGERPPAPPARRDQRQPDDQNRAGQEEVELGPGGEAAASPTTSERARSQSPRARPRAARPPRH